jgi:hypothetical protein
MKQNILLAIMICLLSSCEAIGGIFKTGVGVGILICVVFVLVIIMIFSKKK